jgi:hypothetical protein
MKITLTIKKENLLAIANGDKVVEYRDMTDYYISRFCICDEDGEFVAWKPIKEAAFKAGYSKDAPSAIAEVKQIELVELLDEDGEGTGEFLFAIHLGNIAIDIKSFERFKHKSIESPA